MPVGLIVQLFPNVHLNFTKSRLQNLGVLRNWFLLSGVQKGIQVEVDHSDQSGGQKEKRDVEIVDRAIEDEYGDHEASFCGSNDSFRPNVPLWGRDLALDGFLEHRKNCGHCCHEVLQLLVKSVLGLHVPGREEPQVDYEAEEGGQDLEELLDEDGSGVLDQNEALVNCILGIEVLDDLQSSKIFEVLEDVFEIFLALNLSLEIRVIDCGVLADLGLALEPRIEVVPLALAHQAQVLLDEEAKELVAYLSKLDLIVDALLLVRRCGRCYERLLSLQRRFRSNCVGH